MELLLQTVYDGSPMTMGSSSQQQQQGKSLTRLLQHSILQLCNEHIGYSHKLQILGVLCMTVDDEQHELVVKVNNTLKRVSPHDQLGCGGGSVAHDAPPALAQAVYNIPSSSPPPGLSANKLAPAPDQLNGDAAAPVSRSG